VEVRLPADEVARFAVTLSSAEYARDERDYKVAVHDVVSRLLAREAVESAAFPLSALVGHVTLRYVFRLTSVVFADNRIRFLPHE
jgi:hypothetical protein